MPRLRGRTSPRSPFPWSTASHSCVIARHDRSEPGPDPSGLRLGGQLPPDGFVEAGRGVHVLAGHAYLFVIVPPDHAEELPLPLVLMVARRVRRLRSVRSSIFRRASSWWLRSFPPRIRWRWFSVSPPHTPWSDAWVSPKSMHSSTTGHVSQISRASALACTPTGNHHDVGQPRQVASAIYFGSSEGMNEAGGLAVLPPEVVTTELDRVPLLISAS